MTYGWDGNHPYIYLVEALSYRISDMDVSANPRYYGYLDKAGRWMIVKEDTGPPYSYRYVRGDASNDYMTNWNIRDTLIYGLYNEVF